MPVSLNRSLKVNGSVFLMMSNKTKNLHLPGNYFHVYNRGINRQRIFFEYDNYTFFLKRLNDYLPDSHISIIAYCLMPNHFHLLLHQEEADSLSNYMARACKSYAQAVNKRFNRTGHLFEGKYKIKLIDDVLYLVHLSRYIHLNPVRAGLVDKPWEWEFSSYRAYLDSDYSMTRIHQEVILEEFNGQEDYKDFVESYNPRDKKIISKYIFT